MSDTNDLNASSPSEATLGMSPKELAEARRYGRIGLGFQLFDLVIDVFYLGMIAFFVAGPVNTWLGTLTMFAGEGFSYLRLAALFLLVMFGHILVSAPISFYTGFINEKNFGFSTETFGHWFKHWVLKNVLTLFYGLLMYLGLFAIIRSVGDLWWIIAAGAFFIVSILFGQLAPVLIMPLFYKITPLKDKELYGRMTSLAEGTGLTIEGVYTLGMSEETTKANAMLAGLGATRRILMGDTLLDKFSKDEIDVIFAHEIGHHVHRHITQMIVAGVLFSAVGFYICHVVLLRYFHLVSIAEVPLVALPLLMFTTTVFSLVLGPIQATISRHYERQADRYALARTKNREAYRSAFTKLARINKADPNPPALEVLLFHSHPPIAERLQLVEEAESQFE